MGEKLITIHDLLEIFGKLIDDIRLGKVEIRSRSEQKYDKDVKNKMRDLAGAIGALQGDLTSFSPISKYIKTEEILRALEEKTTEL